MQDKSKIINFNKIFAELDKKKLLLLSFNPTEDISYKKLETDSRRIKQNDVFVCIRGYETDGHKFAKSAIKKGAKLLITEEKLDSSVPQIVVDNSRKAAAVLAKLFFDNPSKKFKLVGITGTNGKTTISHIIEKLLLLHHKKAGVIGTLGYSINGENFPLERTTPDIIDLNRVFDEMIQNNVEYVIMEVSSHALYLDRVFGLHFDYVLFTNLTLDHLDFHNNIEGYAQAKFKLFEYAENNSCKAFINIDDMYGNKLYEKINYDKFSISFNKGDYLIENCIFDLNGTSFDLVRDNVHESYKTKLIGKYNIFNIVSAIAIIKDLFPELSYENLQKYIDKIRNIAGRLEEIPNDKGISIFIDYAHTPDALENVLKTLNELSKQRLICVFGAGGDRDKTKRPKMLKSVLKYADLTIITNDNPRNENPADIIKEIIVEEDLYAPYWILRNRRTAIRAALSIAEKGDLVLVAGKGHETCQIIGNKKIHFNDKEEILRFLNLKRQKISYSLPLPIDILQLEILFEQPLDHISKEIIRNISTDSRTIKNNSLFFALKGKNFNGHDFVKDVLKLDNCLVVVDQNLKEINSNLIRVNNTIEAYGRLASKFKSIFGVTTIAITGSIGKTTTKEYIFNILNTVAPTLKTFANENNLIGLPKTLFNLKPGHKYAILELGSNQIGEIGKLSDICNPDIGIITAVGACHLEFFHDEEGVFMEKTALFKRHLKLRFFPGDDNRFNEFEGITFGYKSDNDYQISNVNILPDHIEFFVNNINYSIPTIYASFVINATIAIAVTSELRVPSDAIQKGLNQSLKISQRMEIVKSKRRTLLIDCYNANPQSMEAAIIFWKNFEPKKPHIAILGDMLELGESTIKFHKEIQELLQKDKKEYIISVGKFAKYYKSDLHFNKVEKLIFSKKYEAFQLEAVILLKASHSINLEKIIGWL